MISHGVKLVDYGHLLLRMVPLVFIGFCLRQFEIAPLVGIRPYNAIAFSGPISILFQYSFYTYSVKLAGFLRHSQL